MYEIPEVIKSRWVKDMSTRMRVFNSQIFDGIYAHHNKDNAEMNYTYLDKNFYHLLEKMDEENITGKPFYDFTNQYKDNLDKLKEKELTDKKAFPPMVK